MSKRIALEVVAGAAGVSSAKVINHFPPEFAVPRDWCMQGARVLLSVEAIRGLARVFDGEGAHGIGNRLRDLAESEQPTPTAGEVAP